jgi:hypothetical protein
MFFFACKKEQKWYNLVLDTPLARVGEGEIE